MAIFIYKAKKGPAEIKNGRIEADTQRAAIYKISQMGYFPLEVKEEMPAGVFKKNGADKPFFFRHKKIGWRELAVFTRQLADLLGAGLTILQAFEVLSRQADNARLKSVVDDMRVFVKDGRSFSGALSRHPAIFSNIYVSMVKAAETAGMLEEVLGRLADYAETQDTLRSKIRSALAYPLLMAMVGIGTIVVLLTFVIPKLAPIFRDMGQVLPLPTLILIRLSSFATHYGWFVLTVSAIAIFVLNRYGKTKEGRLVIDNFKIKLFAMGPLLKKTELARWTRTLGILLVNGVPTIQALEISNSVVENLILRRDFENLAIDIAEGSSFSKAITKSSRFPLFFINMISVGDESGHLDKTMLKVADSYERDIDKNVKMFTALLEPLIILIMGGIVGFVVVSMLLPIFQINLMTR